MTVRQLLHLLIVDPQRRTALAAHHASRWLLPVIVCAERTRPAPLVSRWCAERGIANNVAGQWLGRMAAGSADWLIPISVIAEFVRPQSGLRWISLDLLGSDPSVIEYQRWAVRASLGGNRPPNVEGPFGNTTWPDAVRAWIGDVTASVVTAWTPLRTSAYELVCGADTARGRVYFKGLTCGRTAEAAITQTLASLVPGSFPKTLALEHRPDGAAWWLIEACPGAPGGDPVAIAAELARIQQKTAGKSLGFESLELAAAEEWAIDLLGDSHAAAVVRNACARLAHADLPLTWIPMDLDPANVLTDADGRVRFIDVDDSFYGPAPLAMATYARRGGGGGAYGRYEAAWRGRLTSVDWTMFEVAARVIESRLGWQRIVRNIERREVHAALDLVTNRVRGRLARTICGISQSPVRRDDL